MNPEDGMLLFILGLSLACLPKSAAGIDEGLADDVCLLQTTGSVIAGLHRSRAATGGGVVPHAFNAQSPYSLTEMTDRFEAYMVQKQAQLENFGESENARLGTAVLAAPHPQEKLLVEAALKGNEESRLEAQNAFVEMRNFVNTFKQIIGAAGDAGTCEELTCGEHAYCTMDRARGSHPDIGAIGARCVCNAGYQGNGFVCHTPSEFALTPLLPSQPGAPHLQLADLHINTLEGNVVIALYRDITNSHKGYAIVGKAGPDSMKWHAPVLFSKQSQAFSPVLVQLISANSTGIAIAYRDANRGGNGLLLGGRVDPANGAVILGAPKAFARHQAQGMQMLPLSESRVAVIFAEHLFQNQDDLNLGGSMYGASLLARVASDGAIPQILGKTRFAIGPVARLSATAIAPDSFGIAYRQGGVTDDSSKIAEAACIVGQLHRNQLLFNAPAVFLEPDKAHIWARSLSLVGKDTISYTYHSGDEKITKQAILHVDHQTHRLEVVHGPEVFADGFSPVVGSVALVPDLADASEHPRERSTAMRQEPQGSVLLTVLGHMAPKPAEARLCRISPSGIPQTCKALKWSSDNLSNLASVSGTTVSDGRFVFTMTDATGKAYYQMVGLAL